MKTTSKPGSGQSGEDDLIARYFAPLATDGGAYGLKDDAASLSVPAGMELVVTMDTLVGGVHFHTSDPADLIARKALRVNLSDLAAKGAKPHGFLLALTLNNDWTEDWVALFASGLEADQGKYQISLLGGDTTMSPGPLTISITAFGFVETGKMVARTRAKAGDLIFVSGTIGDAALGLLVANGDDEDSRYLQGRYLLPEPRVELAAVLAKYAHAAMDISDGLLGDLRKMCAASDIGALIERDKIPLSGAAAERQRQDVDIWDRILTGGDDYEILAAVPEKNADKFAKSALAAGVNVTCIGQMEKGDLIRLTENGINLTLPGVLSFSHF